MALLDKFNLGIFRGRKRGEGVLGLDVRPGERALDLAKHETDVNRRRGGILGFGILK